MKTTEFGGRLGIKETAMVVVEGEKEGEVDEMLNSNAKNEAMGVVLTRKQPRPRKKGGKEKEQ